MLRIIKFETPVCQPCKTLEPILQELKLKYGFELQHYNTYTDSGAAAAQQYHVMTTPTVIFLNDTEVLNQIIGLGPKESYEKFLKNLMLTDRV